MRGFPFRVQGKRGFEAAATTSEGKQVLFWLDKRSEFVIQDVVEPRSVLGYRSPSPPTSTATLSSSLGSDCSFDTVGVAAGKEAAGKEEWSGELQPTPPGLGMGLVAGGEKCGLGVDDWQAMLSEASAAYPIREQAFLRWVMSDVDGPSAAGIKQQLLCHELADFDGVSGGLGFGDLYPAFGIESLGRSTNELSASASVVGPSALASSITSGGAWSSNSWASPPLTSTDKKATGALFFPMATASNSLSVPRSLLPDLCLEDANRPSTNLSSSPFSLDAGQGEFQQLPQLFFSIQPKRHQPLPQLQQPPQQMQKETPSFPLPHLRQMLAKPPAPPTGQQQQQQSLANLLFEAAKMVEAGNSVGAQGILARLNHQLPSPSGKPLIRCAFYFKEALKLILSNGLNSALPSTSPPATQWDIVHKLSAYKAFSEVSPLIHFSSFTCVQALLEELNGSDRIHIVDFDIGYGGQWSSFMQELAQRHSSAASPVRLLKITVVLSLSSYNHLELCLVQHSLTNLASDLKIPFEFNVCSLDSFDPSQLLGINGEAVAVNLPVGSGNLSFMALLHLVKQLSPKIVVSIDQGCERADLSFFQHFVHAFQSSMALIESIDASGTDQDVVSNIEKFLLQPRIEKCVLGRHRIANKILPWQTYFTATGFVPIQFSEFTKTQAECLLKRVPVRGFHVDKRHASLLLYWQQKELVSVSAWRC
ncbi:protein NODULATION SIGNALING PATHWAY 2-like [Curcuma longa]|uniref:protein NODULATION SIGNALING PATHWAY 2-like n=1 Tax=Curcuma longa TaxID=136217 RepID=UPI003D9DF094